jgi:uncharacterized protein YecE (DUF72 family)
VLWQLPANLAFDERLLSQFFDMLPRTTEAAASLAAEHDDKVAEQDALTTTSLTMPIRHALEPRHESFGSTKARGLLQRNGIAMVNSDSAGTWPQFEVVTSDLAYVRLHGDTELYRSGYSGAVLEVWAGRVRAWADEGLDVHVYFDNDARGHAPHDAKALLRLLRPDADADADER